MPTWICPYWNCIGSVSNARESFGTYSTTHFHVFNSSDREILVRYEFFQDNGDSINDVLSLIANSDVSSTDLNRTVWPRARQWIGFWLPATERSPLNPVTGEVDHDLVYMGWIKIFADGEILPTVRVENQILRGTTLADGSHNAKSIHRSRYVDCIRVPDENPRSILGRALGISYSDRWLLGPWDTFYRFPDPGVRNLAETDLRICNPYDESVAATIRLNGWNDSRDIDVLIPGHRVQNLPLRIGRLTEQTEGWIEVIADAPIVVDAKAYGGLDSVDWAGGWEATVPSVRKTRQSLRIFGRDIVSIPPLLDV